MMRACLALIAALCLLAPALPAQNTPLPALEAAAEAGDTAAQLDLAARYHEGRGVVQNFARAAALYAQAAEAGNAAAQNRLGQYYHEGLGVARDAAAARRWLGAAAAQGDPQHVHDLAAVLEAGGDPADLPRAAALYAQAAEAGHVDAAVSLGVMYQNGTGVAQDYERARALYEGPAAAGHARAQNNLGLLYVRGHGVAQDYERAAQLFAAAADQGLARAISNLGVMYENGFGVAQNDEAAARLYRLGGQAGGGQAQGALPPAVYDARLAAPVADAALQTAARLGDPVAAFQMGYLIATAENATPAQWRQAADLFRRGAEAGHAAAMANLGLAHIHGRGVVQDYVAGQMWLILAGTAGLAEAPALAAAARARMTTGQINAAQAEADARWTAKHTQ
ncbi:tetratricopeptide repeat protein [Aestuariicoccus sp. MJ-SS9]|uniref:tetratricopeptide repeat protein n=1 Tax=Aestuariicoccus sp. MJ-SS9 TaxID=3079855 RepID=UPI002906E278|nr:tetratricopeptide repeat protein [Aestuariicoccus sp. MJ-SS9]MDU8912172.1 tetratricopeptide repeat protein [Aestuariicoccus sp. MJ-SS9]